MWTVQRDYSEPTGALRLRFFAGDNSLSYTDVLSALLQQRQFREIFQQEIRAAPFVAFRWETPPLASTNTDQPFECLFHDSPDLDVPADPTEFYAHFQPHTEVVSFDNLRSDALLIVPCPVSASTNYSHIGSFHRTAPETQLHALWKTVAATVLSRVGSQPLWLSTAGGGVDWLHIRLDDRPKYYRHMPWRKVGGTPPAG